MPLPEFLTGESLHRLTLGAACGAAATMLIGFNGAGWMLQSTAREMALREANTTLVGILAPICAEKFRGASDADHNMAEFKKVNTWQQDYFIQKGGWATFTGQSSPSFAVARECAELLAAVR
jgi:hypothetical protein